MFQHEYGHYLQSQEMGLAYLAKVGIPSIRSAIVSGPGEHKYQSFEQDANLRAFKYFNKGILISNNVTFLFKYSFILSLIIG